MLFHPLRFLEAELQDAKERSLPLYEHEGKLAVRETERKKAEAVRKSMDQGASVLAKGGACDQVADCSVHTNIHHY